MRIAFAMVRVVAVVAWMVAPAASGAERELSVTAEGRTATYTAASLLALPSTATVSIPNDVAYKRSMTFRAIPLSSLVGDVDAQAWLRFIASDGFAATLPAALVRGNDAVPYLAIESPDAPWPPLKPSDPATAGPFYVVWAQPEKSGIIAEQWPYQVVRIEEIAPLSKRFPAIVPAPRLLAKDPVRRGFDAFQRQCMVCHTINLGGDATLGPDLNIPYNPTEYLRADALRRLIRNPQSLRHWPAAKMPPFDAKNLPERDLNDVIAYLRHMVDRKAAAPVAKESR